MILVARVASLQRRLLAVLASVLLPVTIASAQLTAPLTRVTTGDLVTIPAWYQGSAWGDYDNDGYLDLFVGATVASTRNYLYRSNQDGTFTLIDEAKMPKVPSQQHGAVWGDYDNDGHLDLVVTAGNPGTQYHTVIYHNDGGGSFSPITDGPIGDFAPTIGFHGPSWLDYDNDGHLDLFIAGHESRNRLFRNNGDGTFTRILDSALATSGPASEASAWFDYDNDDRLDLLVGNGEAGNPTLLYRGVGAGAFSRVTNSGLGVDSVAVCAGDYDNDGFTDVFTAGYARTGLFHNAGNGTFTPVTDSAVVSPPVPPGTIYANCGWADYDNDGFLDLFVGANCYPPSTTCQPLYPLLFHNEGDGTFARVTQGDVVTTNVTESSGTSWGDYDRDGFLDLFTSQGVFWPDPMPNLLFHNDGNGNAWLNVRLVGTVSNRSGIGARIRVQAFYRGAPRQQVRTIMVGDALGSQTNALDVSFGLGDATTIDTVRVEWPSGNVQELFDVAPRQFLTITEPLCTGDCHGDGQSTVDELLTLVNVALGNADRTACPRGVSSGATVDIALVVQALNNALSGCGGGG